MPPNKFFNYTKKRVSNKGYKIVETHEDGCNLSKKGIHTKGKRKIYQKMWHPWLPLQW
jgi:hypothetical protein